MAGSPLYVGIGNSFRSDDGVGPWIAGELGARGRDTKVHAGDGTGLIDLFQERGSIVLIDATQSGVEPGTLVTFDAIADRLPAEFFRYSTHRFALAEAVEIARHLGLLPKELMVYGIEGAIFEPGTSLSAPVRAAAEGLVDRLARQMQPQGAV
ncbi:hydrogenase maturation protease [Oricola sp.]|uniref:hydrogenase maturation protease n=1 Tax=Oricola sp. TaxID=1979950 RepID=UPI003BA9D3DB